MTQPTESPAAEPTGGFLAEVKDAVTVRAALLVLGVLALQLAFVTSYIGAFHHPEPHEIPIAVAAPVERVAQESAQRLAALPGKPSTPARSRTRSPPSPRSRTGRPTARWSSTRPAPPTG